MNGRRARALFAVPVYPAFLAAWRDYEERYQSILSGIWLSDVLTALDSDEPTTASEAHLQWDWANDEAQEQAEAIEEAIIMAETEVSYE